LLAGEAVYVDEGFIPGDGLEAAAAAAESDDDGLEEDEEDDGTGE
jgi:hypothetical protein